MLQVAALLFQGLLGRSVLQKFNQAVPVLEPGVRVCLLQVRGQFVRVSGEESAEAIQAGGGVGTITGCIQTLRRNITTRMRNAGDTVGRPACGSRA